MVKVSTITYKLFLRHYDIYSIRIAEPKKIFVDPGTTFQSTNQI